ncbi:MAG: hypothetical protein A2566_03475 [Candidatus Zambryskibacteria bacterium RIFOXYD1_FULL_40_13]|nr:MAG: hypothetical protein UT25_C0002G0172 [Parcubacteria group bacterium GW2011_GWC1_39_12]KKR19328.1 MAG: hypothetical protein UT49_C0002G0174 [Parcubacteria group bacterium GW2011_GWF1_39_37]KKR35289.1 MAG: hypothetical protein UT68_C0004G0097 [Parcubacteria group bacterium GW2011_GWC2_40_10]KKR52279.1 MAG: hypothetical protein UT89_C0002G0080 [Parcubacteria group bacterium GW2011_GWE1_40_20]KKR65168.1 MAG: hypothetical protein UU06_C0027G0008 [Parcubacteria group bacterium GW2011_GWB1_40_
MSKSIKEFFVSIFDFILPPRTDFTIVKKLTPERINDLPRASESPETDWIHPLFQYKDNRVRAIVWELKYKENTRPLEYLGKILFEEILVYMSDTIIFDSDANFVLIPIPITSERRIERGYNQSELIAKSIIQNDLERKLLYAPQWLEKVKDTPKQSRSETKQERITNLVGSFGANPGVEGKYIILIDDVVTTGSTLSEARSTLLSSGAREVVAFTLAH